tara:strand:+ start:1728 stop:2129 length:402 start_codon:yes stop_codon:yes gene_type:complete
MKEITLNSDEETILRVVEKASGYSYETLRSNNRKEEIAIARNILGVLLRQEYNIRFKRIGQIINRNHSSVVYYGKSWEGNYKCWPNYKRMFDKCTNIMKTQNVMTNMQLQIVKTQIDSMEKTLKDLKYKLLKY